MKFSLIPRFFDFLAYNKILIDRNLGKAVCFVEPRLPMIPNIDSLDFTKYTISFGSQSISVVSNFN